MSAGTGAQGVEAERLEARVRELEAEIDTLREALRCADQVIVAMREREARRG